MKVALPRWSRQRTVGLLSAGALGVSMFAAAPAYAADPTPPGSLVPAHVSAPYYFDDEGNDTAASDNLAAELAASGTHYATLAFLQTDAKGSCTLYWNSDTTMPVGTTYKASIDAIRAAGGDVFPSFGGYDAGETTRELADSCTDVNAIAAEYERVIEAYDFTRLDLDIEGPMLTLKGNPKTNAGITRRNEAIKLVQDWAVAQGRNLEIVYTLPTTVTAALNAGGQYLIADAIAKGVRIDGFNIMTFDYYDGVSNACGAGNGPGHDMAADTATAAQTLLTYLKTKYPTATDAELWNKIGIISMPGPSDFDLENDPQTSCETLTIEGAVQVGAWAASKGLKSLAFWDFNSDRAGVGGSAADYQFARTYAVAQGNPVEGESDPTDPDAVSGTVTATIPEGEFVWSVESDSVDLGEATLGSDFWESTGDLMPVNVTDTRAESPAWSISAQVGDFSNGTTTLSGKYLGWEPTVTTAGAGAVAGARVDAGIYGLSVSSVLASAPDGHVKGSAVLSAGLDFVVPLDTEAGTYAATLTLTAIS